MYLRPANLTKSPAAAAIASEAASMGSVEGGAGATRATGEGSSLRGAGAGPAAEAEVKEEEGADASALMKASILHEAVAAASAAAAVAAAMPPAPLEELADSETLLKAFFAEVSDAARDAEVERILACFKLNPYEHLNLRFDASEDDIRRAFRKVNYANMRLDTRTPEH